MISFKNSFLLSEKVSHSEIKSALNDSNILVGIEYEFLLDDYNNDFDYIEDMESLYNDFRHDLHNYVDDIYKILDEYRVHLNEIVEKVLSLGNVEKKLNKYEIKQLTRFSENYIYFSNVHLIYDILSNNEDFIFDNLKIKPEGPYKFILDELDNIPKPHLPNDLIDYYYNNDSYSVNIDDNYENLNWTDLVDDIFEKSKNGMLNFIIDYVFESAGSPKTVNMIMDPEMKLESYPHWDDLPFDNYDFGRYDDSKFIKKYGSTNHRCGLHINMSYKGKSLSELDTLKLMLFMDEGFVWKYFPERKNNNYAESNYNYIVSVIEGNIKDNELEKITNVLVDKYREKVKTPNEKFFGINTSNYNRIEFRYLGSSGYHKKYDRMQTAIGKYAFYLKIALDPNARKKEYILKLERLFNKYGKEESNKQFTIRDVPRIVLTESHRIPLSKLSPYINQSPLTNSTKSLLRRIRDVAKERGWDDVVFAFVPNISLYENKLKKAGFSYKDIADINFKDYIKGFEGSGPDKDEYLIYYYRQK